MATNFSFIANASPKDARTNLRFIALAMDEANDVLPTPGGPTKAKDGTAILTCQFSNCQEF